MHLSRCNLCILLMALAMLGCRRRDPYTDGVLEITRAEKMDLEDQIYALEDKLAERDREIEALRARTPGVRAHSTSPSTPPRTPAPPVPGVMDDSDLMPPSIDPGTPIEPKIELPPVEAEPAPKKPAIPKPPVRTMKHSPAIDDTDLAPPRLSEPVKTESLPAPKKGAPSFRQPADAEVVDPQVTSVFINPFHTTGVELDQQPGDDGIALVFEPRNDAGQFVPAAGEVTIVALDPAAPGDAARVARWELSKTEVGKRLLASRPEQGIKLQLKWPEKRPDHGKLKLFVRYNADDGRAIESNSDVFITLPGQISQRWTPRRE